MVFEHRSYSGNIFRPTPEVHVEEDASLGVIATPWGARQAGKKTVEKLLDFVLSSRQDSEATSPFQKLSCLSPLANNLRVGIMLANDSLYREENRNEYVAGVEVLVFGYSNGELAYAQVGGPAIFIARKGLPWIPLSLQTDLSSEHSSESKLLAPLPQNTIGLHSTTNMNVSSFKIQEGDKLVMINHSLVSHVLTLMSFENADLDQVSTTLSKQHPELPFWLGVLDFRV